VSAIQRFDYSVNLLRALLWQHNKAERLEAIMRAKQAWYDENQSEFWESWFRDVFDLRTADEFGCQVWAAILGVKLTISSDPTNPDKPTFGFAPFGQNFTNGNFGQQGSGTISLTVEQRRLVLRLRYFQLVTRCTTPEINRFMASLFGPYGPVFVQDLNDMSAIVYVFGFSLGSQLRYILQQYDVLPRPATVGISYIVVARPTWGFGEFNKNFENGNFPSHTL